MHLIILLLKRLFSLLPVIPVYADDILGFHDGAVEYFIDQVSSTQQYILSVGSQMQDIFGESESTIGAISAGIGGFITSMQTSMASVGIALAVLFWIIGLVGLATQDRLNMDTMLKSLIGAAVAMLLCDSVTTIWGYINEFGQAIATDVAAVEVYSDGGDIEVLSDDYETLRSSLDDVAWMTIYINAILYPLPIYLMGLVLTGICYVIAISRIIEMNVRAGFLPIAFGLLADDGWRGAGGRYIKKLIAICAQGAVLVLISNVTMGVMATAGANAAGAASVTAWTEACVIEIAVGIASVSVMFKSIGIVNDVFGA